MEQSSTVKAKSDVYQIVTDTIIKKLEQGCVPWKQPWHSSGQPQNLITRRPYRGINLMLLASLGYSKNYFLTARQLKAIDGSIKADEKPNIVVFWNWTKPNSNDEDFDEMPDIKKRPFLRYYKVFNVAQCEGIPAELTPEPRLIAEPIAACEKVYSEMPYRPSLVYVEEFAYYSPEYDLVNMPALQSFHSDEGYYATLFHELIHSTGHSKRLNRKGSTEMAEFGVEKHKYSFEELVAEIGAAYLESHTGIAEQELEQNAAYIKSWLTTLKNDKKFIVLASAYAQKATDYILNIKYEGISED